MPASCRNRSTSVSANLGVYIKCAYEMTMTNNQWRKDFQTGLSSIQPTHMATMNYAKQLSGNRETRFRTIVTHLHNWNTSVLQALFGRKFAKLNEGDAFLFVGFVESGPLLGKDHIHVLIRVPDQLIGRFDSRAASLWTPKEAGSWFGERRTLRSDILIQRIYDVAGAVRYASKGASEYAEQIVWSSDFRRSRT